MKKSIILTAILVGTVSLSNVAFGADEKAKTAPTTSAPASAATAVPTVPPPPPPPLPSPQSTKNTAVDKATKIMSLAQTVVTNYNAFKTAEAAALQDPTNTTKENTAVTAVQNLAKSLEDLMRNSTSLQNDIKILIQQEGAAFTSQESYVKKQKLSPTRTNAEVALIEELQKRFQKLAPVESTDGNSPSQ
jgi:hypothetical protein